MSIIIIGANGQLGTELCKQLPDVVPLTHAEIEICDRRATWKMLSALRPHTVVNTAAYHKVDQCETNLAKAFEVNALAVYHLAVMCKNLNATLVHFSTDYVFGGDRKHKTPYEETAMPWPLNVYGASKLLGERFIQDLCPKHFIVRTSGLFGTTGSSGKGGNFIETMLRLAKRSEPIRVVNDQRFSPTYAVDLAQRVSMLLYGARHGLYHITNSGNCTWYEFAERIFELVGLEPDLTSVSTATFGAKAERPCFSVLRSEKLLSRLRPWTEALEAYLEER